MKFSNTQKYIFDIASLRIDVRIEKINKLRKEKVDTEEEWRSNNKPKKNHNKISKLTNSEILPTDASLIGKIRKGEITKKNPYLFNPTSLQSILEKCKVNKNESSRGLNEEELKRYKARNFMFDSADEIFWGRRDEPEYFIFLFETAVILDILENIEDGNNDIWILLCGYLPLNVIFERLKLKFKSDNEFKKIYNEIKKNHWKLLLTAIFRLINMGIGIKFKFDDFYNNCNEDDKIKLNRNIVLNIDELFAKFYNDCLKTTFNKYVEKNDYTKIQHDLILGNSTEQKLESLLSIEHEMGLYKEDWESYEIEYKGHIERIDKSVKNLLASLEEFQLFKEHAQLDKNFLGYIHDDNVGIKISKYFQKQDREILRKFVNESYLYTNTFDCYRLENQILFLKKNPNSALKEEWKEIEDRHQKWQEILKRNK